MIDIVMDLYTFALNWIMNVWTSLELSEGLDLWSIILVTFISFGMVSVMIRNFGGSGVAHEVTSTYSKVNAKYENEKRRSQSKKNGKGD